MLCVMIDLPAKVFFCLFLFGFEHIHGKKSSQRGRWMEQLFSPFLPRHFFYMLVMLTESIEAIHRIRGGGEGNSFLFALTRSLTRTHALLVSRGIARSE